MKKIMFLPTVCLLSGCIETTSTVDLAVYDKLTSGEKTMEKAFLIHDLLDGCVEFNQNDNFNAPYLKYGYFEEDGKTLFYNRDFIYRFTPTNEQNEPRQPYVKLFDKDSSLTDMDRYCLSMDENRKFVHNDDECILSRRNLLKNTTVLTECVFNYETYIPDYAKIRDKKTFVALRGAYYGTIKDCETKRENKKITEAEYDECITKANTKLDEIVKSGIIDGGYAPRYLDGANLNEFLENDKQEQARINLIETDYQNELKEQKLAEQRNAKRKKERAECLKKITPCGKTKTKGCHTELAGTVESINNKGVLISLTPCPWCDTYYNFIYTTEKYLSNQAISGNHYYEYVGPYEYKNVLFETKRVNAYKETNLPVCN